MNFDKGTKLKGNSRIQITIHHSYWVFFGSINVKQVNFSIYLIKPY